MVNSIKEQTGTREQKPVSPLEQSQMVSQRDWWKVGFLVTLTLFLTTAGVLGFYVLKVRRGEELPQPTQVPTLTPTFTLTPTPPNAGSFSHSCSYSRPNCGLENL